eukprot:CAMPEP_0203664510 /NCGR_PEP_ID=MMETSP0090-20130426/1911_1 /ASSEMBLY_ACC=CAM_ASM_001088 /TAXON_ID=426623 /ORGANISM="Chaetoceros affinis, Strain CCMP159" /LENGTH=564 /DNA_ID=CAMNT_0050527783 /DNA_START=115 /DNA_END=1809 /DNA_ORIENTATION=-
MDGKRKGRSKNKKNGSRSSRKNKRAPRSSGKEYLRKMDFENINVANPEQFLQQTTENMKEMRNEIIEDPQNSSKRTAVEDELKPMAFTPEVKERIQNVPRSKAVSWYIDINRKIQTEETLLYCNIHLVDEKKLVNSDSKLVTCIGVSLYVMKNMKNGHSDTMARAIREKELIMGTFAKTCLNPDSAVPLRGLHSGQSVLPAEVILNTSALVDKMKLGLMELGVSRVSIAHSGLIADGKKLFQKTLIDTRPINFGESISASDRDKICANMKYKDLYDKENYVSEEYEDLGGWVPPDVAPAHWFAHKTKLHEPCRPTELYGWRTNLSRAIENADESKVIEITNAHSAEDVRDFCEISILLQSMAGQGLKESCRLLIEYCSVSVEGVQAPYIKDEWRYYMKMAGHGGHTMTPLMVAACEGYYEVCELLLDHNADICAAENQQGKTALHFAVAMGHRDVVKLLCKRNADISMTDRDHYDAIDVADFILRNESYEKIGCTAKQFEKIAESLREYDCDRCSSCKSSAGLLRQCPCHKERYCDGKCQMQRWHCHKVLHKKVMEKKNCDDDH